MMTRLLFLATAVVIATPLHGQTPEVEPNDSPATATKVALGATAAGVITRIDSLTRNPDWWTFDATAGDSLRFEFDGAWVDLYAEDGKTRLADPRDPVIYYVVKKTGPYFLRVSTTLGGDEYYEIGLWTNRHAKPPCEVANDREPNDIPATARVVAFSERVDGILCPSRDTDYFRFHATRRMRVQIRIDRDTGSKPSAWGNPYVIVGNDRTDFHWKSDWRNGSVLELWVPETGDYVAAVSTRSGENIKYSLTVLSAGTVPTGPGEPAVPRADNMGSPVGFAVGPNGDMYVSDWDRHIWKVSPSGQKSLFIPDVQHSPISLAFDASGNLLVLSWRGLTRVSASGQATTFIHSTHTWGDFEALAVAPDSTIWIATLFRQIKHFDRDGQFLDSISVLTANPKNPYGPGHIAFAPDGTLYFVAGDGIFRLVSRVPELFVRDTAGADQTDQSLAIAGFTFDVEGNLYVTHPYSGSITRYDRTGAEIEKPYAWIPAAPRAIAFGRNADGSTNRRLFVLANTNYQHLPSPLNGTIFELHSSDVDPPPQPPQVTVEDAIAEMLHPGRLSAQLLEILDQGGNRNGRYDIGDLRALLIAKGVLPGSQGLRQ